MGTQNFEFKECFTEKLGKWCEASEVITLYHLTMILYVSQITGKPIPPFNCAY
jgi:hypothetical protein